MNLTRRQALAFAAAQGTIAFGAARAFAADGVGTLESVENQVWGTTAGAARVSLAEAAAIFRNQRLETGNDAAAGVRFIDASKLSLGSNSNVIIDEYVFAGDASRSTMTLAKGAFRFISGQMPEKNMKLQTPTVSIGIRGTELQIDVYEDGSTEMSTIDGAARVISALTSEALDVLAGQSILSDAKGAFIGGVRDYIHKSANDAINREIDKLRSRVPIPIPDILNPFR
ncbi:MAG: FecR domain-containing protein [Alphaproteobacteria bacterium]|nr:FecR domain-containing protein [Alphaproteobacteria bacterium]